MIYFRLKDLFIIIENNKVNQRILKILDGILNYFKNLKYPGFKIYLMYDPIYIIKNFKNNWINAPGIVYSSNLMTCYNIN